MKTVFFLTAFLLAGFTQAQVRIDSSFSFQTDPAKKYSIYVPSAYDAQTPNNLMIGFHPFNPSRWDAISWCDTLIAFAEMNDLLLVCPDGGTDGRVDDPLDTAFTTALVDSVMQWYNVAPGKVYAMGFSVGGRATYTYGMHHINRFGGFMPIGAAVNGTTEVNNIIANSAGKPYYIIHGTLDSEALRFTPIRDALVANGAIVNSNLLTGVGHTIDFANRNQILSDGYAWLDSTNCAILDSLAASAALLPALNWGLIRSGANPVTEGFSGTFRMAKSGLLRVEAMALNGQLIFQENLSLPAGDQPFQLQTGDWPQGIYLVRFTQGENQFVKRLVKAAR